VKKKEIILIGGGGHCKSVIDVIEAENKFQIIGILDVNEKVGTKILGYTIIGTDDEIGDWNKKNSCFHITVGQIKSAEIRRKIYDKLKALNADLPIICSPTAYISPNAIIGEGCVIMHHAILNAGVKVGKNCIINNKALIEHDSKIGDHCHVSTAAVINGDCYVASGSFIGSNSTLIQGITVEENCVVGAGSVVTANLAQNKIVVGNPGR